MEVERTDLAVRRGRRRCREDDMVEDVVGRKVWVMSVVGRQTGDARTREDVLRKYCSI